MSTKCDLCKRKLRKDKEKYYRLMITAVDPGNTFNRTHATWYEMCLSCYVTNVCTRKN